MFTDNNATRIKRELLINIIKLFDEDKLTDEIDRIPINMFPKDGDTFRCCIYKDRAVIRFRLMAHLGMKVEEEDELARLSDYAAQALEREEPENPILTVMQEACKSCVKANYMVTNACQGCLARPCTTACPKNTISIVNGKAYIEPENCINCGRCQSVCPYHAIIYLPVPCEEACPVDAIYRDENGKENIDFDKCIFCGKCIKECPFGAIMERSQIIDVLRRLKGEQKVYALVAPSIVGQFPGELNQTIAAIKMLGFDDVIEVAKGAEQTALAETAELQERLANGDAFMTTSCCPAYTLAVDKHIPELKTFVSHTPTPMHFSAKAIKDNNADAVTVFVGPCVAKRQEALNDENLDFVLTFEELGTMFVAKDIFVGELEAEDIEDPAHRAGRIFPVSGGVATAIQESLPEGFDFKPEVINGITKKEIKLIKKYAKGNMPGNFLECMSCEGGCVAGPGVIANPKISTMKVKKLTD